MARALNRVYLRNGSETERWYDYYDNGEIWGDGYIGKANSLEAALVIMKNNFASLFGPVTTVSIG